MKILLLLLTIYFLYSCEEKIEVEPINKTSEIIAVDGIITNEKKQHKIKLTYLSSHINAEPKPVTGAIVFISNGDTSYMLREFPLQSGIYITDSLRAVLGKQYQLTINLGNKSFFALTGVEPVSPLQHSSYIKTEDTLYQLIPNLSTNAPTMWEFEIDWTNIGPISSSDSLMKAKVLYYYLENIDIPQVFASGKEEIKFPEGATIYERKYSLTQEHADFLRSMLLEHEWTGGNFDAAHANLLTNLSDGAIGFFGACTVVSDSIIVVP
ncbi:MAG: DUF4249 family protein [Bacteroidales bacterium]|nr:DUF4249 family protein [Bacteroidales bacterium]